MKQDTPDKDTNPFIKDGKLDTEIIAKFQEALKSDQAAMIEIAKSLNLAPIPNQPKDNPSTDKSADALKLRELYDFSLKSLKDLGVDPTATPIQSKMSEYEKTMSDKLETIATAKFSEQLSEIVKLDPDFPTDTLKNLSVPTEAKIAIASTLKSIASKNAEGIGKLQKELDGITSELKEVKAKAPVEQTPDSKTGNVRVREMAAKFGLNVNNIEGLQDESTPDAKTQLAEAIKALSKENNQ